MEEETTELDKENLKWQEVLTFFESRFGEDMDLQSILFLIGVQELGQGGKKFKKDEKISLLHIAVCRLLSEYGYYEFEGEDKDGWPHWKRNEKLPFLKPKEQEKLIKQAIFDYVKSQD